MILNCTSVEVYPDVLKGGNYMNREEDEKKIWSEANKKNSDGSAFRFSLSSS